MVHWAVVQWKDAYIILLLCRLGPGPGAGGSNCGIYVCKLKLSEMVNFAELGLRQDSGKLVFSTFP